MARMDTFNQEQWIEMARQAEYRAGALSQKLGISRRHLERITERRFGRSPQNWLDEQRMMCAVVMLKERRSVKSIASDLGFKWVSHFCIKFKRHHHLSPTAFLALVDPPLGNSTTKPLLRKVV
jgi:AraC-like DNA-binding protein